MSRRPTARRTFLATCAPGRRRRGAAPRRVWTGGRQRQAGVGAVRAAHHRSEVRLRGRKPVREDPHEPGHLGLRRSVDAIQGTYNLVQSFGQRLRNQSPLNVHRLFEQIRKGGVFGGAQAGIFVAVLSAVETALWDLAGKALNVPVYQLLGGKFRDRIRVYCDTALYQTTAAAAGALRHRRRRKPSKDGYTAIKFDLGSGGRPEQVRPVQLDRQPGGNPAHGGPVDGGARSRGPQRRHLRRHARPIRLSDRAAGGQTGGAAQPDVARRAGAGGERRRLQAHRRLDHHADLCRRERLHGVRVPAMLEMGAVDIVMPDLQKTGGLGEGQRIANLANLYYVPFAPHMVASFLGAMASCHVCASVPNFMILEWQTYFDTQPRWKEMVIVRRAVGRKGLPHGVRKARHRRRTSTRRACAATPFPACRSFA